MKLNINVTMLILAAAAVGLAYYFGKKTLAAVGNAVNPLNNENVFNQGANAAAQAVGLVDEDSSIGSTIYDGVQNVIEFFGGPPSDNTVINQPVVIGSGNPNMDGERTEYVTSNPVNQP